MALTLRLYRQSRGAWSYFLANDVGGGAGMGNYRTKGAVLTTLGFNPPTEPITAVETYHFDGSDYRLVSRKGGAPC